MSISRDTFDPAKRYRRLRFHRDRDLLDSELNEWQALGAWLTKRLAGAFLKDGSILEGLEPTVTANEVAFTTGKVSIEGSVEDIPAATLTFPAEQTTGANTVYLELLREAIGRTADLALVNVTTGEAAAERERWTLALKATDTSADALPTGAIGRIVLPLFAFDRAAGTVAPLVQARSPLQLGDFGGTIEGRRITLSSLTEDQVAFTASEGLPSLLQNLADRMEDQSGSFVVDGLVTSVAGATGNSVDVRTTAGRAYVRGFRFALALPQLTAVPVASVGRTILNEWKTVTPANSYPLNYRPVTNILDLRANVRSTRSLTKGTPGGSDLLPNLGTFVDIISVVQGATTYVKGVDYQNGVNGSVDWLTGAEPITGTSYEVTWSYTRRMRTIATSALVTEVNASATTIEVADAIFENGDQMVIGAETMQVLTGGGTTTLNVSRAQDGSTATSHAAGAAITRLTFDYVFQGPIGQLPDATFEDMPRPGTFRYAVTATNGSGETAFVPANIVSIAVAARQTVRVMWPSVSGATGYRVYRSSAGTSRTDFVEVTGPTAQTSFVDFFLDDNSGDAPPVTSTAGGLGNPVAAVELLDPSFVLFPPSELNEDDYVIPAGSSASVDYAYALGRRDLLYATTSELKHLQGEPSENPIAPLPPTGTLALAEITCPANSMQLEVRNLALTRVTMEQLHRMLRDIEDLKYNDTLSQMNADLATRDATPKKGIYTDDFSTDSQADPFHPDWAARVDTVQRFVAPPQTLSGSAVQTNPAGSSVAFSGAVAILNATEEVLLSQADWSEARVVPPDTQPGPLVEVTPNIVRPGQTQVTVTASGFQVSATGIVLTLGGQAVASNLTSDAQGRVTGSVTIPSGLADRGDLAAALTDGVRTSHAPVRVGDPLAVSRVRDAVVPWPVDQPDAEPPALQVTRHDPAPFVAPRVLAGQVTGIAQTFVLTARRQVSAVGVWFAAKHATNPATVKIVEVVNGKPGTQALAVKTLAPADVLTTGETKVTLNAPVTLEADTLYALVVSSPGTGYSVRVAVVGGTGQQGVITRQAYDRGNLLTAAAGVWQAALLADLTMKVYGQTYQANGTLVFQPLTVASLTSFALDTYAVLPDQTGLVWEYQADADTVWRPFTPELEQPLVAPVTTLRLRARLQSQAPALSPALNHLAVHCVGYRAATTGTYVTRMVQLLQGVASTKVYAQMDLPSGCSVVWYASNDNGTTWVALAEEPASRRAVNSVWTEYTLAGSFADGTKKQVRYKAVMTGSGARFPRIHRLGATLS